MRTTSRSKRGTLDGQVAKGMVLCTLLLGHALVHAQSFGHDVSRIVVDASRQPLPSVEVSLRSIDGRFTRTVGTESDGSYAFDCVPDGDFEISFSLTGLWTTKTVFHHIYPLDVRIDQILSIDPGFGGAISPPGRQWVVFRLISAESAMPLSGVLVSVAGKEIETDDCGRLWRILPAGQYDVSATKSGYRTAGLRIQVGSERVDLEISLSKEP